MFKMDEFIKHLKDNKIDGATQEAVGKVLGKNQAYISLIKKGERPFLNEYIEILSKEYGEENVMQFYVPEDNTINANAINANNGGTAFAGNGNTITNNDIAGLIELQKGYQQMLKEKDKQIDRLLTIIEKVTKL